MNFPMQLSMFDYSKSYFLPVQALRDPAMEFVLNIESLYELLEVDSETNGLSKTIQFVEDPDRLKNTAEIKEVDGKQLQADRVFDINDYSAAFDHIQARTKESGSSVGWL